MNTTNQMLAQPHEQAYVGPPHEGIVSGETISRITAMANHEAKLITVLYLNNLDETLTNQNLGLGVLRFTNQSSWRPKPDFAYRYCQDSLEPTGIVEAQTVTGRRGPTTGYALTESGSSSVPEVGLLLDWSLRYPDLSLQTIFGQTSTPGQTSSPENRLRALLEVLTHNDADLSTAEIAGVGPQLLREHPDEYQVRLSNADSAVRGLERAGIITAERSILKNTRQFEILTPDYPTVSPNKDRSVVVEAVYSFIRDCWTKDQRFFDYTECLNYIVPMAQGIDESLDEATIRTQLTAAFASGKAVNDGVEYYNLPGVRRLGTFNEGHFTKVALNEDYRPALEDLLNIILAIDEQDPAMIAHGKDLAEQIASDTPSGNATRGMLFDKAYRFSKNATRESKHVATGRIAEVLGAADAPLTLAEVRIELSEERDLSPAMVRKYLGAMAAAGDVIIEEGPADVSRKKKIPRYSLPV
jgi:hypothetical protein